MIRRVSLTRDSEASCTSPSRSRSRFHLLSDRHLRHSRCLRFGRGTEMRAGTVGNDAEKETWG